MLKTLVTSLVITTLLLPPVAISRKPIITNRKIPSNDSKTASPSSGINRSPLPTTHIYLHNYLGEGLKATVNPHSIVLKIGSHEIADNDTLTFTLIPGVISWFSDMRCEFSYRDGKSEGKVYMYSRDYKRCFKHCHWLITKIGIFGLNSQGGGDVVYRWEDKE